MISRLESDIFDASEDDLVVFEIVDEALAAGIIKFREDVVEENERTLGSFLEDEIGFDEFERENDGAGFAPRGRIGGGFLIEVKQIIVVMNAKSGVAE